MNLKKIFFVLRFKTHLSSFPLFTSAGKNLIFVHINKTAGSSILDYFDRKKLHLTVNEIRMIIGEKCYENAIKFCVVRNPYDRVKSLYFHRIKTGRLKLDVDINEWIVDVFDETKLAIHRTGKEKMFLPQSFWISQDKAIAINEILRFENLNEDFSAFCLKYNLPKKTLPHANASKRVKLILDNRSINLINQVFNDDFNQFGYKKILD